MAFVLDASIAVCWALQDEEHSLAALARERLRTETALVPALWWFEVRNAVLVSERRKRITSPDTTAFLRALSLLPIDIDNETDEAGILRLARSHRLSVYDSAYLDLALRASLALATLDVALGAAARKEGVRPIG